MNIGSLLTVLAGLSFFLYGMSVMSSSLEKMAGGTLETVMKKVTSNAFLSFLLGTLIPQLADSVTTLLENMDEYLAMLYHSSLQL